jgi:hypothetical protein
VPASAPAERREDRRRARERERARDKATRRLTALEAEISRRESALEALGWKLGDPDAHRDPERARALAAERDGLRTEIAGLYRDWERVAAELESLSSDAAGGEQAGA